MVEINSETIVSAVLKTLQKRFTSAKRYRDSQNQNIIRPCFFVEQISLSPDKQMSNRVKRTPRIKITYLCGPIEDSLSKHLRAVGDKLLEVFQRLIINDTASVFGREAEYEIVGDELIFTIEYPMHLIVPETPQPLQTNIEPNIDVK